MTSAVVLGLGLATFLPLAPGCDDDDEEATARSAAGQGAPAPAPDVAPPRHHDEACLRVLIVGYEGAEYTGDRTTRTKDEARERAADLWRRLRQGANFAELARAESDARASGERGGLVGTYRRDEWPESHASILEPAYALEVNQLSEVIEAPYGYTIVQRCPLEKVHTRHILVRYRGAWQAPDDIVREKEAARALAEEFRLLVNQPGTDFADIARQHSEDSSAERGGDLGSIGRGRLAPPFEAVAFALAENEISDVVETDFGYHIIQRLADEPEDP